MTHMAPLSLMTNLQVKDKFEFPMALDMRQYTLEGAGAAMVSCKSAKPF